MNHLESRIEPFPALIFNCERAGRLEDLIAPPYDLIDEAKQQQLYARSPNNVVRLELNRDSNPYASAAATLARWISDGILRRLQPAIFLYSQTFERDRQKYIRRGWVVRMRLEEFTSGRILPHERTFPKAKEDRLLLLAATRANISPVFGLYRSENLELKRLMADVASRQPTLQATDDLGNLNQVHRVDSTTQIRAVQQAFDGARVLIADGHHRYETALEYRRRMIARRQGLPLARSSAAEGKDEPSASRPEDYVMMTLVACDDPGLVILPTHRIIRELSRDQVQAYRVGSREKFEVEEFEDTATMIAQLNSRGRGYIGAVVTNTPPSLIGLRNRDDMARALPNEREEVRQLDLTALHALIFDEILGIDRRMVRTAENIEYTIDGSAAVAEVASGRAAAAFLLSPPTVDDIERVSSAGGVMPEKSTYFYPKLQTGLLINPLTD
jgi:uncharacterized protein (DUF1015 family)